MRVFLAIWTVIIVHVGIVTSASAQPRTDTLAAAAREAVRGRVRASCYDRYARAPAPPALERLHTCLTATSDVLGAPALGDTSPADAREAATCWRTQAARLDAAARRVRSATPGEDRRRREAALGDARVALVLCPGSNVFMDSLLGGDNPGTAVPGGEISGVLTPSGLAPGEPVRDPSAIRRAPPEVGTRGQLRTPPPAPPTPPPPIGPTLDAGSPPPAPLVHPPESHH